MRQFRPLMARMLIAMLLLQWGSGPACCLAMMAAYAYPHDGLCLAADSASGHQAPQDQPGQSADHACPACHALGHAVMPPQPAGAPQRIAWSVPVPPAPQPAIGLVAPRAPPQQPRAPPAIS
jgi:hypothetical protein